MPARRHDAKRLEQLDDRADHVAAVVPALALPVDRDARRRTLERVLVEPRPVLRAFRVESWIETPAPTEMAFYVVLRGTG